MSFFLLAEYILYILYFLSKRRAYFYGNAVNKPSFIIIIVIIIIIISIITSDTDKLK